MRKFLPIFISVIVVVFNVLTACGAENSLRGVDVKKNGESYNIVLTTKCPAKMSKTVISPNRVLITLKNIGISENISTKFNENAFVDSIMVEPCGSENASIMIQGDNIAYSDVQFKEPSSIENAEDSIKSSFNSAFNILSGSSATDRAVQVGVLLIFLMILLSEIRFIRTKYYELRKEREAMAKDIKQTANFQANLPGYGKAGLKKPYTTPVYGTAEQTANLRAKYLKHIKTPETITLNSLLHNGHREKRMIDKIVNKRPQLESMSNININDILVNKKETSNSLDMMSNPIDTARLNANLKRLEELTQSYKNKAKKIKEPVLRKSFNKIY